MKKVFILPTKGHYITNPKQCTNFQGKSFKFTISFVVFHFPPNGWSLPTHWVSRAYPGAFAPHWPGDWTKEKSKITTNIKNLLHTGMVLHIYIYTAYAILYIYIRYGILYIYVSLCEHHTHIAMVCVGIALLIFMLHPAKAGDTFRQKKNSPGLGFHLHLERILLFTPHRVNGWSTTCRYAIYIYIYIWYIYMIYIYILTTSNNYFFSTENMNNITEPMFMCWVLKVGFCCKSACNTFRIHDQDHHWQG